MDDKVLSLLLQVIKNDESVEVLVEYGLEYYQISEYINFVLKDEYAIIKDDKLIITEKGINKIKLLNPREKNQWIRPLYEKRIDKMDKYDIYIPIK